METRANYVIVGIFTVVAIVAAFAFVYWTAGLGGRGETVQLRVRIPGSASGLGRGSAVLFNGIKVGDVTRVYIDVNNPGVAIADTLVDRATPITRSTRADIGLAGLTGQANIELKGGNLNEPNLFEEAERENRIAEVEAHPSAVTNLLQTAQDIFTRANQVLDQLEGFTNDVRGPLTATVGNVEKFSDGLARNADGIDKFLASVSQLSETLSGASTKLDSTLDAADGLLRSVDKDQVAEVVANVRDFTKTLADSREQLQDAVGKLDTTVEKIGNFAENADKTLSSVDTLVKTVDPQTVRETVANIAEASTTARKTLDDLAKVSDKIGSRSQDIDDIIGDTHELAGRLNQASVRVDGILAKVDSLLGSDDTKGLAVEARATLEAYKKVADTLNARIGTITDNLSRFSGQGLQNIDALVQSTQRSINRIEEAITDLQRNPQRVLTGGDGTVRQYDGRARR